MDPCTVGFDSPSGCQFMSDDVKKIKQWNTNGEQPPLKDTVVMICQGPIPEELRAIVPPGYKGLALGAWSPHGIEQKMKDDDQFAEMIRQSFMAWFNSVRGIV